MNMCVVYCISDSWLLYWELFKKYCIHLVFWFKFTFLDIFSHNELSADILYENRGWHEGRLPAGLIFFVKFVHRKKKFDWCWSILNTFCIDKCYSTISCFIIVILRWYNIIYCLVLSNILIFLIFFVLLNDYLNFYTL